MIGSQDTLGVRGPVIFLKRVWLTYHSVPASGIANGAGSRDEESSGEGINGYYGMYTSNTQDVVVTGDLT